MSGLSGFGFSAIGALCLWLLPPTLGVPLLMSLSTANQLMSIGQLKADMKPVREWWPDGPAPYLLGGLAGVPIGLAILHSLPTTILMLVIGGFLVAYAAYSMLRSESLHVPLKGRLAVVVAGRHGGRRDRRLHGLPGRGGGGVERPAPPAQGGVARHRAALHPRPAGGFARPAGGRAAGDVRPAFWVLLAVTLPVVLPCTVLGVKLYRSLSDLNFRRVTFMLLGTSGFGLLIKAVLSP